MEMDVASVFVQELLRQLLPWLASLLVAFVIKIVSDLWLRFKLSKPDSAEVLEKVARMAVFAAEQAGLRGLINDKKAYALEWASAFIRENYGLKLNLEDLSIAIEAEVRMMNSMNEPFLPVAG